MGLKPWEVEDQTSFIQNPGRLASYHSSIILAHSPDEATSRCSLLAFRPRETRRLPILASDTSLSWTWCLLGRRQALSFPIRKSSLTFPSYDQWVLCQFLRDEFQIFDPSSHGYAVALYSLANFRMLFYGFRSILFLTIFLSTGILVSHGLQFRWRLSIPPVSLKCLTMRWTCSRYNLRALVIEGIRVLLCILYFPAKQWINISITSNYTRKKSLRNMNKTTVWLKNVKTISIN